MKYFLGIKVNNMKYYFKKKVILQLRINVFTIDIFALIPNVKVFFLWEFY